MAIFGSDFLELGTPIRCQKTARRGVHFGKIFCPMNCIGEMSVLFFGLRKA